MFTETQTTTKVSSRQINAALTPEQAAARIGISLRTFYKQRMTGYALAGLQPIGRRYTSEESRRTCPVYAKSDVDHWGKNYTPYNRATSNGNAGRTTANGYTN